MRFLLLLLGCYDVKVIFVNYNHKIARKLLFSVFLWLLNECKLCALGVSRIWLLRFLFFSFFPFVIVVHSHYSEHKRGKNMRNKIKLNRICEKVHWLFGYSERNERTNKWSEYYCGAHWQSKALQFSFSLLCSHTCACKWILILVRAFLFLFLPAGNFAHDTARTNCF